MHRKNKKHVVIYGGSFNPPHRGHASAVKALLDAFPCDEIWIMPSGERGDKRIGTSGRHRMRMLHIMRAENFPKTKIPVKISGFELRRRGLSNTYRTSRTLKRRHPSWTFSYLVGSDILKDVRARWVNGGKLYREARFVCLKVRGSPLPKKLPERFWLLDLRAAERRSDSGKVIRALVQRGVNIAPYVGSGVAAYIKKRGLYGR